MTSCLVLLILDLCAFVPSRLCVESLLVRREVEDAAGEVVHDRAIDRARWHFAPRRVALRPVGGGGA